jgi:flagellar hook-associated protein 2
MAGGFSAGGLITGIDSNTLISQLMQLERQPIVRIRSQIDSLEKQRTGIRDVRTSLTALRDAIREFQTGSLFDTFAANSTDDKVVTASASGSNPAAGSFLVNVLQVASATTAISGSRIGAPINPNAFLEVSGIAETVTAGTFTINGQTINLTPNDTSLNDALAAINASGAGVTATYDAVEDRVIIRNTTPGDTSFVNFGATGDTSNFLSAIGVQTAAQLTGSAGETEVVGNRRLGAVNPAALLSASNFSGGAVTAGNFYINGTSIAIDPATDSLSDVIARINGSDAEVSASYDPVTDTIRVVAENLGSRTIGFQSGTSNFLDVVNLTSAVQTAGNDAQYTVNGGPVQTSNSNSITDALPDVTLELKSVGAATVGVELDDEAIVEGIREFVNAFNESIKKIDELLKKEGVLENDGSIRQILTRLRDNVFSQIAAPLGGVESLLNIGISSGSVFDPSAVFQLQIDETKLSEALLTDRAAVKNVFTQDDQGGVLDQIFVYLDDITGTAGFLNERARANGSIDRRIDGLNDRIEGIERRIEIRERRLRQQFATLERLVSEFQAQGQSLSVLNNNFGFNNSRQ